MADAEGLRSQISFEQADGTALHFANDTFDLSFCSTVLEETHAQRMLAELVRVTKPGGHIAAITRAVDVDWWVNLNLSPELVRFLNQHGPKTGAGVGADGCADASLYVRAVEAGITQTQMGPQFAVYRAGERLEDVLSRLSSAISPSDQEAFDRAVDAGRADGSLMVCEPFHCLVGTVG